MDAPASDVPLSYEQAQHLRAFRACQQRHEEMARLLVVVWDEQGRCNQTLMKDVLTSHLRRHDTYHSWFQEQGDALERRTLTDPESIELEAIFLGEVSEADWQQQVKNTPGPFDWDCFRFGILQRANSFTCFACVDHLHADSSIISFMMDEIHAQYCAACSGDMPPRQGLVQSYARYCINQHQRAAALKLQSTEVLQWIDFLHRNHGRMPQFPLPLGKLDDRCLAEYKHAAILDAAQLAKFEATCDALRVRMIGGLLACAAMTEREVAGTQRYSVVSPTTTRQSPQAFRMSGWCMGIVPIDFESGTQTFPELAKLAQKNFDERRGLASIPIERVLELAADLKTIRPVATGGVMLSYMDMKRFVSGAKSAQHWQQTNGQTFINQGMAAQVALWLFRTHAGLTLLAAYPSNSKARGAMQSYLDALRNVCRRVVQA